MAKTRITARGKVGTLAEGLVARNSTPPARTRRTTPSANDLLRDRRALLHLARQRLRVDGQRAARHDQPSVLCEAIKLHRCTRRGPISAYAS